MLQLLILYKNWFHIIFCYMFHLMEHMKMTLKSFNTFLYSDELSYSYKMLNNIKYIV